MCVEGAGPWGSLTSVLEALGADELVLVEVAARGRELLVARGARGRVLDVLAPDAPGVEGLLRQGHLLGRVHRLVAHKALGPAATELASEGVSLRLLLDPLDVALLLGEALLLEAVCAVERDDIVLHELSHPPGVLLLEADGAREAVDVVRLLLEHDGLAREDRLVALGARVATSSERRHGQLR